MSLLNQVLRDLDAREESVETLELKLAPEVQVRAEEVPVDSQERDWPRLLAWTLVVGAVLVWAGIWYYEPDLPSGNLQIQVKTPLAGTQHMPGEVTPVAQQSGSRGEEVAEQGVPAEEQASRMSGEPATPPEAVTVVRESKTGAAATYVPLKITEDPQLAEPARKPAKIKPQAVRPSPENHSVTNSTSVAKARSTMVKTQKAVALSSRAKRLIDLGELSQAEQLLRELLATSPTDKVAHELLVGLLLRGGRDEEVLEQIDVAHSQSGYNATLDLVAARLLMQKGDQQEAALRLQAVVRQQPENIDALRLMAARRYADGRLEQATRIYQRLVLDPKATGRDWLGLALSTDGIKSEVARHAYRQAGRLGGLDQQTQSYILNRLEQMQEVLSKNTAGEAR